MFDRGDSNFETLVAQSVTKVCYLKDILPGWEVAYDQRKYEGWCFAVYFTFFVNFKVCCNQKSIVHASFWILPPNDHADILLSIFSTTRQKVNKTIVCNQIV